MQSSVVSFFILESNSVYCFCPSDSGNLLTVSSSKQSNFRSLRWCHSYRVYETLSEFPATDQTLNGVHVPLQFRIMSDHRSNFPLQPFVHKFFTNLTKTFLGRYLCLADSGKPFCIVVKHPQFEVSILLLGIDKTFIPTLSQTLIEHWWGWWDPPFNSLLCPTIVLMLLSQPSVHSLSSDLIKTFSSMQ